MPLPEVPSSGLIAIKIVCGGGATGTSTFTARPVVEMSTSRMASPAVQGHGVRCVWGGLGPFVEYEALDSPRHVTPGSPTTSATVLCSGTVGGRA